MSQKVIEDIAEMILDCCDDVDEVEALLDNVLVLLKDELEDEEWQPALKDLREIHLDSKDDEYLVKEVEDEHLEVLEDEEGFKSLR